MDINPAEWDNRVMFERYLYDYLKKRNMHLTAEVFRRETNLLIEPLTPPNIKGCNASTSQESLCDESIDVPDGFLHEWWLTFFEMFSTWQLECHEQIATPTTMAEKLMQNGQQSTASLLGLHQMNEHKVGNLTAGTESGLAVGGNSVPSTVCSLIGGLQMPQLLSASQHQQGLASSSGTLYQQGLPTSAVGVSYPARNLFNSNAQEVGCSAQTASVIDNIVLGKGAMLKPQLLSSPQHQLPLPTPASWTLNPSSNHADWNAHGVGSSVHPSSRMDNTISNMGSSLIPLEIENYILNSFWVSEKYQNLLRGKSQLVEDQSSGTYNFSSCSQHENKGSLIADFLLEASFMSPESMDEDVEPASSHAFETENKLGAFLSNGQRYSTAPKRRLFQS